MIRKLWAKITRKGSEKSDYPIQQATYLGRVADVTVLFPYGMHANLPIGQTGLMIDRAGRVFMGASAVGRITVEEGEVVFFHPQTKSKTTYKNSGNVDIESAKDVNVKATNVNVDADVTNLGVGGLPIARAGDPVQVVVTSGSSAGTYTGTITMGGSNTST